MTDDCCEKCQNFKAKYPQLNEHVVFHIDRIRRILASGKVVIPQNSWSNNSVDLETLKEKLDWILTSCLELGITHQYQREREAKLNEVFGDC